MYILMNFMGRWRYIMNFFRPLFFMVFLAYAITVIPVYAMDSAVQGLAMKPNQQQVSQQVETPTGAEQSSVPEATSQETASSVPVAAQLPNQETHQTQNKSAAPNQPQQPTQQTNNTQPFSFFDSITSFFRQSSVLQITIGIGLAALCVGWIISLWKNKKKSSGSSLKGNPFKQQVVLGNTEAPGIEFSAGNVRVIQLPVAQQKGLSCGYHALKNGILLASGNFQVLHDEQFAERLFHYASRGSYLPMNMWTYGSIIGPWRAAVRDAEHLKKGHYTDSIDDLSSNAIEYLVRHEKNHGYLMNKSLFNNIEIFAIDDIRIIGASSDADHITPEVKKELTRIQTTQGVDAHVSYKCIFLLNTGHEYEDVNSNMRGTQVNHWFAVVLEAAGAHHTYYVADSLGAIRVHCESQLKSDALLKRLVNTIEGEEVLF